MGRKCPPGNADDQRNNRRKQNDDHCDALRAPVDTAILIPVVDEWTEGRMSMQPSIESRRRARKAVGRQ